MKCLHCEKEIVNTVGKRAKTFCGVTCRSNYWQKKKRREAASNIPHLILPKKITPTITPPTMPVKANDTANAEKKPFMSDAIKKKLGLQ